MRILLALVALTLVAAPATAQEPAFDSGDIQPGRSWSWTFEEAMPDGHHYHCHPHPWMTGMVHVVEDTDGETEIHEVDIVEGADSDDWGYSTQHLFIEVGDTVVWTNTGDLVHTVTAESGEHADGAHDDGHADGAHDDGHADDHVDDHADDQDAPLPLVAALAAIGTALLVARRR